MCNEITNRNFYITGATGLIGQRLIKRLLFSGAKITAVVRSIDKAKRIFGENQQIAYVLSDIKEIPLQKMNIDYIIHAAANTSSKAFIQDPVGIAETAIEGTRRVLELARLNEVKGLVFLSSMEVYGTPETDEKIDELHATNLNTMAARSCYPESKRMCESLCTSYASQYGVPAKVVRLTQTFGPGVQYDDGRVFAEFSRCVIEGRDIILHTKGETKRNYLHVEDAVEAILTVLFKGEVKQAYNAANEDTYCSIFEMANMVANECADGRICVQVQEADDAGKLGYAPTLKMNLSAEKLKALGWSPRYNLKQTFQEMIQSMKQVH